MKYCYVYNEEAVVFCSDDWIATQPKLGCTRCGRVQTPYAVNAQVEYVHNFTDLTTRTSRRRRPKHEIGGSVTMIAGAILEEIGWNAVEETFFVGSVSCDGRVVDSHFTLTPRRPENALRIRSESPLDIVTCPLCDSENHAFDGPAHVVASDLTDPIYPTACSANQFVIRKDIAQRLRGLGLSELEIEPLQIKPPNQ